MALFVDEKETFRVDLDDGAWVEMRSEITYGDRQAANRAATGGNLQMRGQPQGGKANVGFEASWSESAFVLALLERMIVAWSEDVPVNRQNIERLPERSVDLLLMELNERNAGRSQAERDPLVSSSTLPSEMDRIERLAGQPS